MNNTHMLRTLAMGVVAACLLAACQGDDTEALSQSDQPPALNLLDPAPGQRTLFERITLQAGDTIAETYPDTLLLEVIAVDLTGGVTVQESLSEWSAARFSGQSVSYPSESLEIKLSPKPTELQISGESRLFPTFTSGTQSLNYMLSQGETSLQGDRLAADYLPLDRTLNLRDNGWLAELQHGRRDEGYPGLTFVHDQVDGLYLSLVEFDLSGNAEGWRAISY